MQPPDYISEFLPSFTPEDTAFHVSEGKGFHFYADADSNWGSVLLAHPCKW